MPDFPRICFALCAIAGPLSAQVGEHPAPDPAHVRLIPHSADSPRLIGVPVFMGADTVRLVLKGTTDTVSVAVETLRGIDEFRGRRSNWDRGALIGGMVLGIGGAIAVPVFADAIGEGSGTHTTEAVAVGLVGGAIAGGLLGAGIGAMTSRERWVARPIAGVRRVAARDRVHLGLALGFTF